LVNNNKNITLRILGGAGNQLFLFSFLVYLEKKYKLKVHIDYKSGYQNFLGGNIFQQKFLLNKLNYNFFYQKDKYCFLGFFGKIKRFFYKNFSIFSKLSHTQYLVENHHSDIVAEIKKHKKKNIYIEGYFHDIKYVKFSDFYVKNIIYSVKQYASLKKNYSNVDNVLCVLFSNYNYRDSDNKIYLDRLKNLITQNKNFNTFVVFSAKDPFFLKKISSIKKYKFFKPNNKIDSLKNIILMSNFKNYLIDNSTYHWWGSWLSENSKKIIFIPNDFNSKIIYSNCKSSFE